MVEQFSLFSDTSGNGASLDTLSSIIDRADTIYIKKLAVNDWEWTEDPDKHQGGVFIPHKDRDSGFFPELYAKTRAEGHPILESFFEIVWPTVDVTKRARLVHYTSKGQETHLTGIPKTVFAGLPPASLLVIGRKTGVLPEDLHYSAMVANSGSPEFDYLTDLFEIGPSFRSGLFVPARTEQTFLERIAGFTGEAVAAYRRGTLDAFAVSHESIPPTKEMAAMARALYMDRVGLPDLNPFNLDSPGDIVREISRGVEYELFREYELRFRSMQLARIILAAEPAGSITVEKVLMNLITGFHEIDRTLLSASQQRKSRAGYSFEHHIQQMLADGKIPHDVQVIMEAKKRPDFVLPTYKFFKDKARPKDHALVLSAKTTLRERWKQVLNEIKNCDLYLATVDEDIAANAIEDMNSTGIVLVVPESLKKSDTTVYGKHGNVITFRDFFRHEIKANRFPVWAQLGMV